MAIDIKNYVDISTTFPSANAGARSFGGLVFTGNSMLLAGQADAEGHIPPKDINGNPCDRVSANTYKYDNTHNWVWNDSENSFTCTIDNEVLYPTNYADIRTFALYQAGTVIQMNRDEIKEYFGVTSPEYKYALGYYSYISPSGRFASKLSISKILAEETPSEAFLRVNKVTNLFGSFTFLSVPYTGGSSSATNDTELDALVAVARENALLDTKYLFVVADARGVLTPAEVVSARAEKFKGISGTCYVSAVDATSAYMPMAIFASTDYADGQVVNFMFKQFDTEAVTVASDSEYTLFNKNYVNFYGRTQSNGQTLDFYQRGFNMDGVDSAIYCNEVWFKSACETNLVNLLVSRERIPADAVGVDMVKLEVIGVCGDATTNGTFMQKQTIGRDDLRTVREIINSTGGDATTVEAIEADLGSKGYSVYAYLGGPIEHETKLGKESEYVIVYYVFYGTADSVRYIKGNDILLK